MRIVRNEINLVANDSHARIGDRVEDLARLVGRGVIDDQEFEISEALAENAIDCTAEMTCSIVHRHEYRYS